MAFTDAFTGFFKKDKAAPNVTVTNVDAGAELGKGAQFNVDQTTAHQARAQGIDAQEKARFNALFGGENLAREQRNLDLSDQFATQGFSAAQNTGLQSALRQFTGAAAQGAASTGLWGRGAGLPISVAANRTADQIGRGQQYGLALSQSLLGNQQNRSFAFENAANTLWQSNLVRPETFLQQANWNTERKDSATNQNALIDWQNSKRKSLFEQGIQRSMSSALDLATNPQTQIGVATSVCGGNASPQTYPGANPQMQNNSPWGNMGSSPGVGFTGSYTPNSFGASSGGGFSQYQAPPPQSAGLGSLSMVA